MIRSTGFFPVVQGRFRSKVCNTRKLWSVVQKFWSVVQDSVRGWGSGVQGSGLYKSPINEGGSSAKTVLGGQASSLAVRGGQVSSLATGGEVRGGRSLQGRSPLVHGHLPCVRALLVSGPRPTCYAGLGRVSSGIGRVFPGLSPSRCRSRVLCPAVGIRSLRGNALSPGTSAPASRRLGACTAAAAGDSSGRFMPRTRFFRPLLRATGRRARCVRYGGQTTRVSGREWEG